MLVQQRSLARSAAAKPFTGVRPQHVVRRRLRAAEEEEAAGEAVDTIEVDIEEDAPAAPVEDFVFSYSDAKRNNQWEASEAAAAIAFYTNGEGDQPEANTEFVTNPLGIEVRACVWGGTHSGCRGDVHQWPQAAADALGARSRWLTLAACAVAEAHWHMPMLPSGHAGGWGQGEPCLAGIGSPGRAPPAASLGRPMLTCGWRPMLTSRPALPTPPVPQDSSVFDDIDHADGWEQVRSSCGHIQLIR